MTCKNCGLPKDEHRLVATPGGNAALCPTSFYSEATPEPIPLPPSRQGLLICPFGNDDTSISETQDWINCIFETGVGAGLGNWDTEAGRQDIINTYLRRLREARTYGIHRIIASIDFCLLQANPDGSDFRINLADSEQRKRLHQFFQGFATAGGIDDIVALYLYDEPNLFGPDGPSTYTNCRTVLEIKNFYTSRHIWLTSCMAGAARPWPGIKPLDAAAFDDYPLLGDIFDPGGGFDRLKAEKNVGALMFLYPGTYDPYWCPPEKFYEVAQADREVAGIIPFQYIGTNGMRNNPALLAQWRAVGRAIKAANP